MWLTCPLPLRTLICVMWLAMSGEWNDRSLSWTTKSRGPWDSNWKPPVPLSFMSIPKVHMGPKLGLLPATGDPLNVPGKVWPVSSDQTFGCAQFLCRSMTGMSAACPPTRQTWGPLTRMGSCDVSHGVRNTDSVWDRRWIRPADNILTWGRKNLEIRRRGETGIKGESEHGRTTEWQRLDNLTHAIVCSLLRWFSHKTTVGIAPTQHHTDKWAFPQRGRGYVKPSLILRLT